MTIVLDFSLILHDFAEPRAGGAPARVNWVKKREATGGTW